MMKLLTLATLVSVSAYCEDTETKVKMKDLPPAVQRAVAEQSKGATLKGLAKEVEDGKTFYEAELKVNGRTRDVSFDETGKVVSVEQEIPIDSIPAAAREAIKKQAGAGKIKLVEQVTKGSLVYYEAHVKTGGKESEIEVKADGSPVK